jgi:hypothetical protein
VPQHDHGALVRVERGERGERLVRPAVAPLRGLAVHRLGHLAAQRARARPVDRPVHDDPVQPRPERAPAVEAVERADGRQERLLGDVLRGYRVVDDQVRGPVRGRPVRAEQRLHRLLRAGLCLPDPRALAPAGGPLRGLHDRDLLDDGCSRQGTHHDPRLTKYGQGGA